MTAALVFSGAVFFMVNNKNESRRILEIRDSVSGRSYGRWHLEEDGEFAIEFIHSVNQSPVRETFVIEEGVIRLKKIRFYSFGAGIPSELEESWIISRDGDAMVISGFNTSFEEINFIVGTVSDHLFFINGETISLRELCGRNAQITLSFR